MDTELVVRARNGDRAAFASLTEAIGDRFHGAVPLPSGVVLIAGGTGPSGTERPGLVSAELYDPATGTFHPNESGVSASPTP